MARFCPVLIAFLWGIPLLGQTADLARRILDAGLDPDECYRVRDLTFARDDIRLYFNDGYLIFGKAIDGVRLTAIYAGDEESGDAEVIVLPPKRSERMSLATYTGSPNLNEHFRSAVLVFTDRTHNELAKLIAAQPSARKSAERGLLLADQWNLVVRNFCSSFQTRLVKDLLSENRERAGFFHAGVTGLKLGNFDLFYDPTLPEQITIGQVAFRDNRTYFDVWTRFTSRAARARAAAPQPPDLTMSNYRIEAALDENLRVSVTTRAAVVPGPEARRALAFDISPLMRVSMARIDGVDAEVFQPDSMRSSLIRGDVNETFLVVPPRPLQPGREYEIEFRHAGDVVADAGNGVYYVGARGSWYPNRSPQFARYDLTFRYPSELDLVATGRIVEDVTEGEWRVTRRRTDSPVRMAGFNLGKFERQSVTKAGYTVEVYANRQVERALERRAQRMVVIPTPPAGMPRNQRWTVDLQPVPIEVPQASPTARLEQLAVEIAGGLEFMASHFGPPVLKQLTVSPIPGTFGQGFPGLIFLSTLAYLDPAQRPQAVRSEAQQTFYSEILHAHETAHQWWGNVVTSAADEDNWIMEALANYSALLYLEKRKGARAVETVLAEYRNHLLDKRNGGVAVDSAGPIIWGLRLANSQTPAAWRIITYEKGSWIVHMLRRRMGDDRFLAMLGQLRKRYQFKPLTTEQFRGIAAEFLPARSPDPKLEGFFEQFVFSTGVPSLKLNYSVRGKAPQLQVTGTVAQSDVDDDFSAYVPVEIQFGKAKPIVHWVQTSNEPVPFKIPVRQSPTRVVLDPNHSILRK